MDWEFHILYPGLLGAYCVGLMGISPDDPIAGAGIPSTLVSETVATCVTIEEWIAVCVSIVANM